MASQAIINAYVRRIRREEITLEDVPTIIRDAVKEAL
jgi:hypothetical protein|nr:MAG TPA: hypothetical protein [Caudoviricetes sp.]